MGNMTSGILDNADVMNNILSNCCPSNEEEGVKEFDIDLHCAYVKIMAESDGWNAEKGHAEYRILSVVFS